MKIRELGMILNLSCEEASRLVSESLDRPLTRGEKIALRMHTLICRACRLMRQQMTALHELAGRIPDSANSRLRASLPQLSADRRQRIKKLLADARQGL